MPHAPTGTRARPPGASLGPSLGAAASALEKADRAAAMRDAGRGLFMLTKGRTTTVPWLEELSAAARWHGVTVHGLRWSAFGAAQGGNLVDG